MARLLDWSTADPQRKLQLFRFIDVLPALSTDEEVAHHLADYLLAPRVPLPEPLVPEKLSVAVLELVRT